MEFKGEEAEKKGTRNSSRVVSKRMPMPFSGKYSDCGSCRRLQVMKEYGVAMKCVIIPKKKMPEQKEKQTRRSRDKRIAKLIVCE